MAFAVEDFEDLLKLLDEHPEWRARLRSTVLGDDWEDLPQAVRNLVLAQQRTEARVEELAHALQRLAERIDVAVEALTSRMDDMTREFGYMYEMFFERRAAGIFQDWLIRPRPVSYDDLPELQAARETGVVTQAEMKLVGLLDLLLSGRDPSTREPAYIAVEVSRTVNPEDVDRATKRAEILRKAGLSAHAAVGGRRISHEAQELADANGVIVAILAAQPA